MALQNPQHLLRSVRLERPPALRQALPKLRYRAPLDWRSGPRDPSPIHREQQAQG